jgi:hypothetical protein
MNMLGPSSSVRITQHDIEKSFLCTICSCIHPLMLFEMSLWKQSHIYMQVLQLFTELIAPTPNAICIKCYDFERPMNSSNHFVALSQVPSLLCPLIQLHWALSWSVALQWLLLTCHCQTNWEPVLTDLFSEFPIVADAAERCAALFCHLSAVPVVAVIVLTHYSCIGLFRWGELTEERPPRGSFGISLCYSPFAWLQAMYDPWWGFCPSTRAQLQQLSVDSVFIISRHSLCRWPPPHHSWPRRGQSFESCSTA